MAASSADAVGVAASSVDAAGVAASPAARQPPGPTGGIERTRTGVCPEEHRQRCMYGRQLGSRQFLG